LDCWKGHTHTQRAEGGKKQGKNLSTGGEESNLKEIKTKPVAKPATYQWGKLRRGRETENGRSKKIVEKTQPLKTMNAQKG